MSAHVIFTDKSVRWPPGYVEAEVRPGHGREVSTVVMPDGRGNVCGVDSAFLAAAAREVLTLLATP